MKRICEEKEVTEICVKDLEFLTMNRSENGFYGIMAIEAHISKSLRRTLSFSLHYTIPRKMNIYNRNHLTII